MKYTIPHSFQPHGLLDRGEKLYILTWNKSIQTIAIIKNTPPPSVKLTLTFIASVQPALL